MACIRSPGRGDGPPGPSPGGTLPVQTGAQGRHHLGRVPDQVILDLPIVHDQDAGAPGRQGGLDVLEPETAEPLPVFDYDRAHRGVADGPAQLPPVSVQTGPDFLDDLIGAAIMLSGPLGQPAGRDRRAGPRRRPLRTERRAPPSGGKMT